MNGTLQVESSPPGRWPDYLTAIVIVALGTALLPFVLRSVYMLIDPFTVNYSEDSLLASAMQLALGRDPYATYQYLKPPYVLTPYPPVYYLTITPFLWLTGPSLIPGRIVSIVSTILVSVIIYAIVRRETGTKRAAVMAGIFYLGLYPVNLWGTHHRVDNLTLLLALLGLYIGTARVATTRRIAASMVLLLLSAYTKQTSVAAFVVVVASLWGEDRKRAAKFGGIFIFVWALLFVILCIISHGGYYFHTVVSLSSNPQLRDRFMTLTSMEFQSVKNLLALLLAIVALVRQWIKLDRWALYAGLALLQALLTVGKIGSGANYFLEFAAAVSILTGLIFAHLLNNVRDRKLSLAIACVALIIAVGADHAQGGNYVSSYLEKIHSAREASGTPAASKYILENTRQGDMILTQRIDLALMLGRVPVMNDPFTFSLLAELGLWDDSQLVEMIRSGALSLVILETGPEGARGSRFLTGTVKAELSKYYDLSGYSNLYFYKPKAH